MKDLVISKFVFDENGLLATGPRIYLIKCQYSHWMIPYVGKTVQGTFKREREHLYGAIKLMEGRAHHGDSTPGCRLIHQHIAHCLLHGEQVSAVVLENPLEENLSHREEYYKSVYKSPLNEMEYPLLGKLQNNRTVS